MDNKKEYILCAAWRRKSPRSTFDSNPYNVKNDILDIEIGYRHHDIYSRFGGELSLEEGCMGFYISKGRFVSRTEAMEIAYNAGQIESERRAKWSQKEIDEPWLPLKNVKEGDFKPLASEDLYCCSPDGNTLNE